MTKFYMTKAPLVGEIVEPIAINLDNVLFISPFDNGTIFRLINDKNLYIGEKYEDVMRNITPFVPFNEMINDSANSEWMRNYLNNIPKGVSVLANDNNG